MILTIITDAAAKERARYVLRARSNEAWVLRDDKTSALVMDGPREACQAHLERLVQIAVLRALHEAGYAVVEVSTRRKTDDGVLIAGYEVVIAAAPAVLEEP